MDNNDLFQPPQGEEQHHRYQTKYEKSLNPHLSSFNAFIHNQITTSTLLLLAVLIAIILASLTTTQDAYMHLQKFALALRLGFWEIETTAQHFVNDFLMTLFFFMLGLEIKKEYIAGDLSEVKTQNTVLTAALGGVLAPALLFVYFAPEQYELQGWGIPVATDTAIALGVLALFRKRVPPSLFAFVAAFAVIDDLCAILILALFYTQSVDFTSLLWGALFLAVLIGFNLIGVRRYIPYLLVGVILWICIEHSGLHGTLAGVLVALTIPARPRLGPQKLIQNIDLLLKKLKNKEFNYTSTLLDDHKQKIIQQIHDAAEESSVPLTNLRKSIEPFVIIIILPIFALLNAGVPMSIPDVQAAFHDPLAYSLIIALIFGKSIGIFCSTLFVCKTGIGQLPKNTTFSHIIGVAFLAGIGFTMSIFIAELAFANTPKLTGAKTGVLIGSFISGLLGFCWLYWFTRHKSK